MTLKISKKLLPYILIGCLLAVIVFLLALQFITPASLQETPFFPTPTAFLLEKPENTSPIKQRGVFPPEDASGKSVKNPSQVVSFQLSETVNPRTIRVDVSPQLPVKVRQGKTPEEITVFPDPPSFWKPNVLYRITIYDTERNVITSYFINVPRLKPVDEPI